MALSRLFRTRNSGLPPTPTQYMLSFLPILFPDQVATLGSVAYAHFSPISNRTVGFIHVRCEGFSVCAHPVRQRCDQALFSAVPILVVSVRSTSWSTLVFGAHSPRLRTKTNPSGQESVVSSPARHRWYILSVFKKPLVLAKAD